MASEETEQTLQHSQSFGRVIRGMTAGERLAMTLDLRNWPALLLVPACIIVYIAQLVVPLPYEVWGFSGKAIEDGHYVTWLTSIFMHGSIVHIWMNMTAYLSFAPLVCARFGRGVRALVPYYVFYILCGLAGNSLYWLLHPQGHVPVVGASGAIYGLVAAAFRLDIGQDKLRALFSKPMLAAWRWLAVSNVIVILVFGGPAIIGQILEGHSAQLTIPIAWEAHVGGFVAGIILISVMAGKGWHGEWRGGIRLNPVAEL